MNHAFRRPLCIAFRAAIISYPLFCALLLPVAARTVGYDAAGRMVWTIQPGGNASTFTYDRNGNLEVVASITPSTDSDDDGLPDYFELQFTGLPTALSAGSDEDGDGRDNLFEFAFDLRPDAADGFEVTPVSLSAPTPGTSDQTFSFTYRRPTSGPALLAYRTEVSFDLQSGWTEDPANLSETITPVGEGAEEVTVRFTSPVSTANRLFLRVFVERQQP